MPTKVLVAYASKYGSTAQIADKIGGVLKSHGLDVDELPVERVTDLSACWGVVVGSAVYTGQWRKDGEIQARDQEIIDLFGGCNEKKYVLIVVGSILTSCFLFGLYLWVGSQRAIAKVERAWANSDSEPLANVGTTERLEILPIYEEAGNSESHQIGHGLSYLIKTDSTTVLMDVGAGPEEGVQLPAAENVSALGIELNEIDALLFTRFHPDHTGGGGHSISH